MDDILIILSGLIHTHKTMYHQAHKLKHYLKDNAQIKTLQTVQDHDLMECHTIIFMFPVASQTLPSCMIDYLKQKESLMFNKHIYNAIYCDEYEYDYCQYSYDIMNVYCGKTHSFNDGALMIGSYFLIDQVPYKWRIANKLDEFARNIIRHKKTVLKITYFSKKQFLQQGNRYWKKAFKKEKD